MINNVFVVDFIEFDETPSIIIEHTKLNEIRIVCLEKIIKYNEEDLQSLFDNKLSDKDLMLLITELRKFE